jgi:hypothetical protein
LKKHLKRARTNARTNASIPQKTNMGSSIDAELLELLVMPIVKCSVYPFELLRKCRDKFTWNINVITYVPATGEHSEYHLGCLNDNVHMDTFVIMLTKFLYNSYQTHEGFRDDFSQILCSQFVGKPKNFVFKEYISNNNNLISCIYTVVSTTIEKSKSKIRMAFQTHFNYAEDECFAISGEGFNDYYSCSENIDIIITKDRVTTYEHPYNFRKIAVIAKEMGW